MSASMNPTLGGILSKNGRAKGRLSMVILTSGYCLASESTTGTVIATSPSAENLIISMCSVLICPSARRVRG